MTAAILLAVLAPVTAPVGLILVAHAWIIPELYAARGAGVVRQLGREDGPAQRRALGLLGDLLDDDARALQARTGLVLESGRLGVWLVSETGAILIRPGGRRVSCYCIRRLIRGCPPATASPTCCSRCELTSPALPPWPTSPSAEPDGDCAVACPGSGARRLTGAHGPQGAPEPGMSVRMANARRGWHGHHYRHDPH